MRWLLLLLLTGCAGAWYEPHEIEARTDWTDIDHDQDFYDGDSMSYGISLRWPLGVQRQALDEQARMGEHLDRIGDALERQSPPPIVITAPAAEKTEEPISILGVDLPRSMFSSDTASGIPMFAWGAMALVLIAAAAWIFKGAGVKWLQKRRKPKEPTP